MTKYRESTKAERAAAFKFEQRECANRLRNAARAVTLGDMEETRKWHDLVLTSLEYLFANSPQREK